MRRFRGSGGSITVEAALVVPFVALIATAFVACMQLVLAEMALQRATSQTVKLVSAHLYPLALAQRSEIGQQVEQTAATAGEWVNKVEHAAALLEAYEAYLPGNVSGWLADTAEWFRQMTDRTADAVLGRVFLPVLKERLGSARWIDPEDVSITNVVFPNFGDRSNAYFGLTAAYTVRLRLPFYRTTITIEVDAYERVWLAG